MNEAIIKNEAVIENNVIGKKSSGIISWSLMKKTIKDNWKLWTLITAVLCFFIVMFISISVIAANRGGEMGGGMGNASGQILEQFYTMFGVLLALIFVGITANKLIAAQVDKGSLSYVMVNPIKRNQVSITQGLFLATSVIAMFAMVTVAGLAAIGISGSEIAMDHFLLLNLGAILLMLATSGISFLASCIFNRSGASIALGIGIPVMFFLFTFLGQLESLSDIMVVFKYLTINSLFNMESIAANSLDMIWQFLILFAIFAATYIGGIAYFKKKDLPL